jgi:hypothetical protein
MARDLHNAVDHIWLSTLVSFEHSPGISVANPFPVLDQADLPMLITRLIFAIAF